MLSSEYCCLDDNVAVSIFGFFVGFDDSSGSGEGVCSGSGVPVISGDVVSSGGTSVELSSATSLLSLLSAILDKFVLFPVFVLSEAFGLPHPVIFINNNINNKVKHIFFDIISFLSGFDNTYTIY